MTGPSETAPSAPATPLRQPPLRDRRLPAGHVSATGLTGLRN